MHFLMQQCYCWLFHRHYLPVYPHNKIFLSGYLINTLNPGAIAFWITATTSFIAYSLLERTILFATCLTLVFIFDIIKVVLAGKIRQKLNADFITTVKGVGYKFEV